MLMAWQEGRCAVCGRVFGESMFVDHDHLSWLIRGLLCPSCNIREGRRTDDYLFAAYRRRHPAAILGLSVGYRSGEVRTLAEQAPDVVTGLRRTRSALGAIAVVLGGEEMPAMPEPKLEKRRDGLIAGVQPRAAARTYVWTPRGIELPVAEQPEPEWQPTPELLEHPFGDW